MLIIRANTKGYARIIRSMIYHPYLNKFSQDLSGILPPPPHGTLLHKVKFHKYFKLQMSYCHFTYKPFSDTFRQFLLLFSTYLQKVGNASVRTRT